MQLSTRILMPVGLLALAIATSAALTLRPSRAAAPDRPSAAQIQHAGALFRHKCASCHFAPNTAFATDRAWLGQVNRTS